MGTHLRVLGESFPMSTNVTGFRWFSKLKALPCFVCSLSIGRVKPSMSKKYSLKYYLIIKVVEC